MIGGVAFVALLILIAVFFYFRRKKTRKTATPGPVEPMRAEQDEKAGQMKQAAHLYHPDEIYEAPGVDVITRDVKDSSYPGK